MQKKLCFLVNKNFIPFGIANSINTSNNFDLFAIISDNNKNRQFFEQQNIVPFKKTWFMSDYHTNEKLDLEYLKKFEKSYSISLWEIAYSDRLFYSKYNKFHKFTADEILSIIEQSCKCFEDALDTIKPDYVLTSAITSYYEQLLYKICNSKQIPVLAIEPVRFGDRWYVSKGIYNENEDKKLQSKNSKNRSIKYILEYLKSHKPSGTELEEIKHLKKISKWEKSKALVQFLISNNKDVDNLYTNYGKTKLKILSKGTARSHLHKTKKRESFIDKNFLTKINDKKPFIYFPLQEEPEKSLLIGAPFYSNQLSVLSTIVKFLPVGYDLFVKEHPSMKMVGWRDHSFYEEIMDLPNAKLIHPSVNGQELVKKCSLVITIRGTTALEAAVYQKPAIVFNADYGWDSIHSIHILKNIYELPNAIQNSLQKKILPSNLNAFMDFVETECFDAPIIKYVADVANHFKYNVGYMKQPDITQSQMELFLQKQEGFFKILANNFLQKINY